MPNEKKSTRTIEGQRRGMRISWKSLIGPFGPGLGRIMDSAIIAGVITVFNIGQMPRAGTINQQAGALLNIDPPIPARPDQGGADDLDGFPIPRTGAGAGQNFSGRGHF
jgi:hypothetical protein